MRKRKIVADSSADITSLEKVPFGLAPLKIIAGEKEFVDEIEKIPDDETVEISAGTLKSFICTYNTTLSYLDGDMDKVKDYLTSKKLI